MNEKANLDSKTQTLLVHINGRVQGVGFRPFIYRLARKFDLKGYVFNRPDGLIICIEGSKSNCSCFLNSLRIDAPKTARIKNVEVKNARKESFADFVILPSHQSEKIITEICPDIAVCEDCLREMYAVDRRSQYPFINCTNCGPRFTLIDNFPYDRQHTTMRDFEMCPICSKEYSDMANRRFHAQPVSCPDCGPVYKYHWNNEITEDFTKIRKIIGLHINEGRLVALKGLGGYNVACDATNSGAVKELRSFKKREKKPFAVMFRSVEALRKYIEPGTIEIESLCSWQRPIVIIDAMKRGALPPEITAGLSSLGAFLPYLPLHYLLFDEVETDALVITSGNESDIPILYQEERALEVFKNISGGILVNNRIIARRADDSVVKVINNQPRIFRRARGYVPAPVELGFDADNILATGAELSNCFCIGKKNQAILSQHIGDLKNAETFDFYVENVREFSRMYRFQPKLVACDLHPDYLSTRYAENMNVPVIRVQHHHAHIAAVMAEYHLNSPVIGLSYDGTGYGTDGNIWGSELLIAGYKSYERISHFEYVALPGGDTATREPWRSALAYLYHAFGKEWKKLAIPYIEKIDLMKANQLVNAIDKKINSPLCCSAGRLFDAVAALLTICIESDYHAQAPMLLENYIDPDCINAYSFKMENQISFVSMIRSIVNDIIDKKDHVEIVTKFHNTIANAAMQQVLFAVNEQKIKDVIVCGGTFQNKYLTEKLVFLLEQNNLKVFLPAEVPCNDGGIALGQIAVAAFKNK